MVRHLLQDVFGVSSSQVLSYVERNDIDDKFKQALSTDKQIVVYGASKQGKTSLVSRYLPYEQHIVIRLTPKMTIQDLYHNILRQANVKIEATYKDTASGSTEISGGLKFRALIPIFGGAEASAAAKVTGNNGAETSYEEIPFNLELAHDVSSLLQRVGCKKTIILENFHYLDEEKQKQFAFDLRTFQEIPIRIVILGVWREKNRLAQFVGDLLDRIIEVPVEPWKNEDFVRVAQKGCEKLHIKLDDIVLQDAITASFQSIGVFQEILKAVCALNGITQTVDAEIEIKERALVAKAVTDKSHEYGARHQRVLEAIAGGNPNSATSERDGKLPLFLPYYLVRVILEVGYDGVANGLTRSVVHERIKAIHHRPDDVRASDMSNLLHNLAVLQANQSITPPIIDYDRTTKSLQVVDSTLYFFLKHAELDAIKDELPNPLEAAEYIRNNRDGNDTSNSAK